uniref:Glycoside hydrolase family 38 central domain-containing protein n=2 Tax=Branchiostoma floridae TaxID=7739 RepID=C3ZXS8_BRAFL|eukprot:XP_002586669.1 hypothetical protein BRAFLDRAFT_131178 [Branchiostoma floridae]
MWRLFLLNQFHDVLPGSCIKAVVEDAVQYYQEIQTSGCKLLGEATERLLGAKPSASILGAVNTLSWDREELLEIPAGLASKMVIDSSVPQQELENGTVLVCASCPSMGYAALEAPEADLWPVSVSVDEHQGSVVLENGYISASIDYMGRVTSLGLLETGREAIAPGCLGNQFVLFDDIPLYWDAWDVMDYHLETRKPLTDVSQQVHIVESGPLRAAVQVQIPISDVSSIRQTITLDTGSMELRFHTQVEWHENRKFLKVEFPLHVRTTEATYETAFGHLRRPTHQNTSWDWARYEVCGHKWADLSEYNFGVALMNDCKYGHCAQGNVIRLSLLKSPKAPDSEADMGHHSFTYVIMPHMGTFQDAGVIQAAYSLNQPLLPAQLPADTDSRSHSFFTVSNPAVILETVKKAEDVDNAIVLRLYESCGGHGTTTVSSTLPITRVDRHLGTPRCAYGAFRPHLCQVFMPRPSFRQKPDMCRPTEFINLLAGLHVGLGLLELVVGIVELKLYELSDATPIWGGVIELSVGGVWIFATCRDCGDKPKAICLLVASNVALVLGVVQVSLSAQVTACVSSLERNTAEDALQVINLILAVFIIITSYISSNVASASVARVLMPEEALVPRRNVDESSPNATTALMMTS